MRRDRAILYPFLGVFVALWLASPVLAQSPGEIRHLTVYDSGVAQVVEERTVELQNGLNTLEWRSLLPRTYLGTVRILSDESEVVRQSVSFDGSQVQGSTTPVLHFVLDHKGKGGRQKVRIDYLAPNLDWNNDYSLVLDSGEKGEPRSATLDSWVSVQSSTGQDLVIGELDLIAGEISLSGQRDSNYRDSTGQQTAFFSGAVSAPSLLNEAPSQAVSAFQRFTLGRDMALNANAPLSRFPLFQRLRVPIEQRHVFENGYDEQTLARNEFTPLPRGLEVRLVSKNPLTSPIPPGTVTIYSPLDGFAQIVGQDSVPLTPAQGQLTVSLGKSSTVFGTRRITERRQQEGSPYKLTTRIEIVLTNRGPRAVTAWVREGIERYRDNNWSITESTLPAERIGANNVQLKVEVPAGGSTTLAYTVVSQ